MNEGETTDTTSGPDEEALQARMQDPAARKQSVAAQPKKEVKEGIRSSSDEEDEGLELEMSPAQVSTDSENAALSSDSAEPLMTDMTGLSTTEFEQVTKFTADNPTLFENEQDREQTEHKFGFSKAVVEDYSNQLENKIDNIAREGGMDQKLAVRPGETTAQESEADLD